MHRVTVSLYAAALFVLIPGLCWGPYALSAKERLDRPASRRKKWRPMSMPSSRPIVRSTRRKSSIDSRRKASHGV